MPSQSGLGHKPHHKRPDLKLVQKNVLNTTTPGRVSYGLTAQEQALKARIEKLYGIKSCKQWDQRYEAYKQVVVATTAKLETLLASTHPDKGFKIAELWGGMIRSMFVHFFLSVREDSSTHPFFGKYFIGVAGSCGRNELVPGGDLDPFLVFENPYDNRSFANAFHTHFCKLSTILPGLDHNLPFIAPSDIHNPDLFTPKKLYETLSLQILAGDGEFATSFRHEVQKHIIKHELDLTIALAAARATRIKENTNPLESAAGFNLKLDSGGLRELVEASIFYGLRNARPYADFLKAMQNTHGNEIRSALQVLLHARAWLWVHLGKNNGKICESFDKHSLLKFSHRYGAEGLERLWFARCKISRFSNEFISNNSAHGIKVCDTVEILPDSKGDPVYTLRRINPNSQNIGVSLKNDHLSASPTHLFDPVNHSQGFYNLLLVSQLRGIPISPQTISEIEQRCHKGVPSATIIHPRFLDLLRAPGILSQNLELLSFARLNLLGTLFPHWKHLEFALYEKGHRASGLFCSARSLQRLRNLEQLEPANRRPYGQKILSESEARQQRFFEPLYNALNSSDRLALRLALLAEEIPDKAIPNITAGRWVADFSAQYPDPGMNWDQSTCLLMERRRKLSEIVQAQISSEAAVRLTRKIAHNENELTLLTLFTFAAYDHGVSDRMNQFEWDSLEALYQRTLRTYAPLPNIHSQESPIHRAIHDQLPIEFEFSPFAVSFKRSIPAAVRSVLGKGDGHVTVIQQEPGGRIQLLLTAEDRVGLVRELAHTFYTMGIQIEGFQFFTWKGVSPILVKDPREPAPRRAPRTKDLVLDFFALDPRSLGKNSPSDVARRLEEVLRKVGEKKEYPTPFSLLAPVLNNPASSIQLHSQGNLIYLNIRFEEQREGRPFSPEHMANMWYGGATLITELGGDIRAGKPNVASRRDWAEIMYVFQSDRTIADLELSIRSRLTNDAKVEN